LDQENYSDNLQWHDAVRKWKINYENNTGL